MQILNSFAFGDGNWGAVKKPASAILNV